MEAPGTVSTPPGDGAAPAQSNLTRAGFEVALALSALAAVAATLLAGVAAYLALPQTGFPAPLPDHHQDAETLVFVLAFAVIVPLTTRFGPRLADRIAAGPNGVAAPLIAASLTVALLGLMLAVKVSERLPWGGGLGVALLALIAWWVLAAAVVAFGLRSESTLLARLAPRASLVWMLAAALLAAVAVAFAYLDSIAPLPVVLGILAVGGLLAAYGRVTPPKLPVRLGAGYDVLAAVLLLLAVPNLVIFYPEDPSQAFITTIIHFHQNFFLGPANHVVGGDAMLVDTLSQYGVGSIDFIAGWFELVGTSNGTLGLLDGMLSGLVFAAGYFVMRAVGISRLLASVVMLVAVVALVYNLLYPIGGLLQHGAIRFGMPMGVLAATIAELRWPRAATAGRVVAVLLVGISSIWALEAFGYTLLTFGALLAARVALLEGGERRPWLVRRAGEAVAACVAVHVLFALATLAAAGELPDWGLYLNTLREFLTGTTGDLTYDFSPWSPGLLAGAVLITSAVATILLISRKRELAVRERTMTVALAGTTAYGVALFSYLVNRSADHIVPYVCLPALMATTMWLALLLRHPDRVPRDARRGALTLVAVGATLMVGVAWSAAADRFSESAIAYVPPGGKSLGAAIDRLEDPPPLSPGAPEAQRLLDANWPDEEEAAVLVEPDLGIESLARTGRINRIPLSNPWEDSFVADTWIEELDPALEDLEAGDLLLIDANARSAFESYRSDPSIDPLEADPAEALRLTGLAILQGYSLQQLSTRFRLRTVERGDGGLEVVELVPDDSPV